MDKTREFFTSVKKYLSNIKKQSKVNNFVQDYYNKYSYGYSEVNDGQLLMKLQNYNMSLNVPYLATGQSGYFHEQIMSNGLGSFKLNPQDIEDAKFISKCFGKNTAYSSNNTPITYATLLGTTEFNYASQSFPAGIYEDVFQCSPDHDFPIQPLVGEKEEDYYLRVLEYQINSYNQFDSINKQEVLNRGKRLIHNFCGFDNKMYLIPISDLLNVKASFGDVNGLRDGNVSGENASQIVNNLQSLSQLLSEYNIDYNNLFNNPNMDNEFGIALYGVISTDKIQYIDVKRKYDIIQRKALELGYSWGDVIPNNIYLDINSTIKR